MHMYMYIYIQKINRILASRMLTYIKKVTHHDQVCFNPEIQTWLK